MLNLVEFFSLELPMNSPLQLGLHLEFTDCGNFLSSMFPVFIVHEKLKETMIVFTKTVNKERKRGKLMEK